jgi:hypothetical protein
MILLSFAKWERTSTNRFIKRRIYINGRWTPFIRISKRLFTKKPEYPGVSSLIEWASYVTNNTDQSTIRTPNITSSLIIVDEKPEEDMIELVMKKIDCKYYGIINSRALGKDYIYCKKKITNCDYRNCDYYNKMQNNIVKIYKYILKRLPCNNI